MPASRTISACFLAGLLSLPLLPSLALGQAAPAPAVRKRHKGAMTPRLFTPVVEPAKPLLPAASTLADSPATAPTVAFQNNQLSISAPNSTLGDILRAVHRQTGAAVEIPPNATERVVGVFGPGPAREVLAQMLNGSHFNYVILSSAENVGVLDRVVLLQRTASETSGDNLAGIVNRPGAGPSMIQQSPDVEPAEEAPDDTAEQEAPEAPQVQQEQPQQAPGQPGVRTPEQLLQELQRRQQGGQPGGFPQPQSVPEQ